MRIINVYDALIEGDYSSYLKMKPNDINSVHKYTGLNMLQLVLTSDTNQGERIRIVEDLLRNGININYCGKDGRNALHILYFENTRTDPEYLYLVSEMLLSSGIDCNKQDKYGAIPLVYAINNLKHKTEDIMKVYELLLEYGSDPTIKDSFNNDCNDYCKKFSWRSGLFKMMEGLT